ncbi:MAG: hypothetical protein JW832_15240 [Deltaproteobacteria bacterium]|nr:hypothetical protein [Deltaproteobacteria bacterium]
MTPPQAPDGLLGKGPGEDSNEPTLTPDEFTGIAVRWCALFFEGLRAG